MKLVTYTIQIALLAILFIGCQEDVTFEDGQLSEQARKYQVTKTAIKSLGPVAFSKNKKTGSDDIVYAWESKGEGLTYDMQVFVNRMSKPVLELNKIRETKALVQLNLEVGDLVIARIKAVNGDGTFSPWFEHAGINRNGGSAVTLVPRLPDWRSVCDLSTCEYVRFIDNAIDDCYGGSTILNFNNGFSNYYEKDAICDCLDSYDSICEGLQNINDCLINPYFKRGYEYCGM